MWCYRAEVKKISDPEDCVATEGPRIPGEDAASLRRRTRSRTAGREELGEPVRPLPDGTSVRVLVARVARVAR